MEFKLLIDKTDAIPLIATWYFNEWGSAIPDNSYDKTVARLQNNLSRNELPIHLLAVKNESVLGVAQLKIREMSIYPEREHWLGGLFVPPEFRGRGIASEIAEKIASLAQSMNIEKVYLQTEKLDGGFYARLGWKPMEKVFYNGFNVLVMERELDT